MAPPCLPVAPATRILRVAMVSGSCYRNLRVKVGGLYFDLLTLEY
jgi:hypothetical protein